MTTKSTVEDAKRRIRRSFETGEKTHRVTVSDDGREASYRISRDAASLRFRIIRRANNRFALRLVS